MAILVMVAKRPTFTPDQLKIGGNHLLYEVQMFCNTAALMEEGGWEWGWKDKTEYMAVLESFLMHTRSLMYFLCPPRGYRWPMTGASNRWPCCCWSWPTATRFRSARFARFTTWPGAFSAGAR